MTAIRVMPESLANKIAAGEVVERPASVVKELVENSIDAGATQISVEVEGKSCCHVRVVDNGHGMASDDALLALERHATSKIFTEADLLNINSLGFRGEALPSIAAVSKFVLRTRRRDSTAGTEIQATGGVLRQVRECGCPAGTLVGVRHLFYNQPVRRKFLRTERTEFGHILDVMTRLALARPEIHFSLSSRGRVVGDWTAVENLEQRLHQVYQTDIGSSWLPVTYKGESLAIDGFLSPPELHRANGKMLFFYVNRRAVRDRLLLHALMEAYRTLLPKGRFPLGVLFIAVPAAQVDVNVHPSKAEVRFQDARGVTEVVKAAARRALTPLKSRGWRRSLVSAVPGRKEPQWIQTKMQRPWSESLEVRETPAALQPAADISAAAAAAELPNREAASEAREQRDTPPLFGRLTVIGQLHHTYILCESEDGLILIDQHAAHERCLFDKLRAEVASSPLPSQQLLAPATLEFSGEESGWLQGAIELFAKLGFAVTPFGSNTFIVRSVPAVAMRADPLEMFKDMVAEAYESGAGPDPDRLLERALQSMACKLAVKAGQKLTVAEMTSLLSQLDEVDYYATCPHGRPFWWKLTTYEIGRFFGRL
ncbi:MAG: DNA mismatch repair endonuclease MutL [Deltaproteobacteria bacterium]|nr:DNA mismatch repair endonuclease MutL [Deltaproteobacteria bacterium]